MHLCILTYGALTLWPTSSNSQYRRDQRGIFSHRKRCASNFTKDNPRLTERVCSIIVYLIFNLSSCCVLCFTQRNSLTTIKESLRKVKQTLCNCLLPKNLQIAILKLCFESVFSDTPQKTKQCLNAYINYRAYDRMLLYHASPIDGAIFDHICICDCIDMKHEQALAVNQHMITPARQKYAPVWMKAQSKTIHKPSLIYLSWYLCSMFLMLSIILVPNPCGGKCVNARIQLEPRSNRASNKSSHRHCCITSTFVNH